MSVGTLAGTVWVNVLPKMDEFQRNIGRGMAGVEKRAGAVGKTLTRNVSLPLLAAGAASIKLAVDFDETFDQMIGLAGVSEKSIEGLKTKVMELAEVTGKAPKELAEGLYFIESSGLKGKAALEALNVSAKLSAAGLGETQVVADTITSAMNAYASANLTAAQAGDILAATVRDGKGEASAIAPVLGGLLPLSKRLGVGFDQVGASIASMTLLGTSAPEAGTALTGFYTSLLNNSPKVTKALKSVGLTAGGLRKEMADPRKGLPSVLKHLEKAFGGNIDAMHEAFPNIRGLRALLALTGDNAKKTQGVFQDLSKSAGSVDIAFGAVTKDKAFKFKQLQSQIKNLGIEIGTALLPFVIDLATKVGNLIKWYKDLSPEQQGLIKKFVKFVAVMGPALWAISKMISTGRKLKNTLADIKDGLKATHGAFKTALPKMRDWIKSTAQAAWQAGKTAAKVVASWVKMAAAAVKNATIQVAQWAKVKAKAAVSAAAQLTKSAVKVIAGWVTAGAAAVKQAAVQVARWIATAAAAVASAAVQVAAGVVVAASWVRMAAMATASAIRMAIAWLIALGPIGILVAAVAIAAVLIVKYWDKIKSGAITAFNRIKSGIAAVIGFIRGHWQTIVAIMLGPVGIVVGLIMANWGRIKAGASAMVGGLKGIWGGFIGFFKSLPGKISSAASGMWNSVKSGASSAVGAVKGMFSSVINWIKNALTFTIDIPDNIPGLPNSYTVSAFADGGYLPAGQLGLVGERGPEFITGGARGSTIMPMQGKNAVRMNMTITNWRDGTGYFDTVADGSVRRAGALANQRGRMHR